MYLGGQTYQEIDKQVKELLEDYSINSYPIMILDLAEKIGIKCVPYSQASNRGFGNPEEISDDAFTDLTSNTIFYNDKVEVNRLRFSIAHEIGHIWLEHRDSCPHNEAEANHFAAYLLAPTPLILKLGFTKPQEIADYFKISNHAAYCALQRAESRDRCGAVQGGYEYEIIHFCLGKGGDQIEMDSSKMTA